MRILDTMRKQTCVHWERTGVDDDGQPTFADGVELRVRWEDVNEQYITQDNETLVSRSKVYVARDLAVGDVLWLGSVGDVDDADLDDPFAQRGAYQIRKFDRIPTLKATDYLRVAWL